MKKEKNTTPSGEDYLEAILILQRQKGLVRPVDIARHMEFSKPSITHAITTLLYGGFVEKDTEGFIHLTDIGREVAEQTYEKHCFFTRLLMDAGVEPKAAEQDAWRMEHVISPASFQKLAELYQRNYPNIEPTEDGRRFNAETDPAD